MTKITKRKITPVLTEATLKRIRVESPKSISPEASGTRKISSSLLITPPPPTSFLQLQYSNTDSLEWDTSNKVVTVPTDMYSARSYEFLGYTEDQAKDIYSRWVSEPEDQDSFIDFAISWLTDNHTNALDDADDWYAAMNTMGIEKDLQTAMMDQKYRNVRLTRDLVSWLVEVMEDNWASLESMDWTIDNNLNLQKNASKVPHLRGGEDLPEQPKVPENHIVLYKSLMMSRLKDCFDEDGGINLGSIMTSSPSDFASKHEALYFTPQRWVADQYAGYAKRKVRISDVLTLELHVPNDHLSKLVRWDLDFCDGWRELVWHSRRAMWYTDSFRKFQTRQELIVGPIAHNHDKHFRKMKEWTNVKRENIMISEETGEIGIQYVWMKGRSVMRLDEDMKNKFYLHKTFDDFKVILKP
jgi:hypothetical protein